jgi:hypothetical protein
MNRSEVFRSLKIVLIGFIILLALNCSFNFNLINWRMVRNSLILPILLEIIHHFININKSKTKTDSK